MKKVNILKSFKFCGNKYVAGQTSPSKRFPTIPFKDYQISTLVYMKFISVDEPKETKKEVVAPTEKKAAK